MGNQKLTDSQIAEILKAHNFYRAKVGSPPLTWSDAQASQAADYAAILAQSRKSPMPHSSSDDGENLAFDPNSSGMTEMVGQWQELKLYTYGPFPDDDATVKKIGHYTQIVWKTTTTIGCGIATDQDGGTYLVCRYTPPGNYVGKKPY